LFHFRELFTQKSDAVTIAAKEKISLTKRYQAHVSRTPERGEWLVSKTYPWYHTSSILAKTPASVPKEWTTKLCGWSRVWDQIVLECEILTGRTHQIRYHCAERWLPLIGDNLYNDTYHDHDGTKIGLSAVYLSFVDTDGVVREWSVG